MSLIGMLLALTTIAVAGLAIWDLHAYTVDSYRQNIRNLGVILAEQVARTLQSVDLVLRETASEIRLGGIASAEQFSRELATERMHGFLASGLRSLPQADSLILVGADGRTVNFSRFWPNTPIDLSDRDYYRYFLAQDDPGPYISEPVQNRVTGTWTSYLVRPIRRPDGALIGLVLAGIQTAYFESIFNSLSLQQGTAAALFRRDGLTLARAPSVSNGTGLKMPADSEWYALVAAGGGQFRSPGVFDGVARTVSLHPRTDYPVVVGVTVAEQEALAPWRRQALLIGVAALCAVVGFALLFRMIAAQFRRLEDQAVALRRARDEANFANRSKSEFLANMSHELRTPLNSVIGFSEVILSGACESLGEARWRGYVGDIRDSGRHLLAIINDLLDLAQIDAGRMRLEEEEIDVGQLCAAALAMVRIRAEAGRVTLEQADLSHPVRVWADERLLKQAVLNLLSNAVKFTLPHGTVRILVLSAGDGTTEIRVTDTGIGMRQPDIARAMEPFVQIDGSLQRRFEGTGLGLPLTQAMIELHGGTLQLESREGEGTVAILRLPVSRGLPLAALAAQHRCGVPDPHPETAA